MKLNKRHLIFITIVAMAIVAVLVIALVDRGKGNDAIHIGSILILSGDYSSYGEQFRDGATIAIAELNRDRGSRPVEVIFHDSEGSKSKAVELVQTMFDRDGVRYVADIMGTGLALEAAPSFNERQMLVLSGVNTGPELTNAGGNYFFRIIPSDVVAASQLVDWALELGLNRAVVVHDVDDWGKGLASEIKRAYRGDGVEIVDDIDCQGGLQLVGPLVGRIAATHPQVVFLLVYPREAGLIIKESARLGVKPKFMGTDNLTATEFLEHGGDAATGVLFVLPGTERPTTTTAAALLTTRYRELRGVGVEPPLFTVMAYDVVTILADAARRFGDDTTAAAQYLRTAKYEGASGQIAFSESGDVQVSTYRRMIFRRDDADRVQAQPYSASEHE